MKLRSCLLFFFCFCLSPLWSQETYSFSVYFDHNQYLLRPEAVVDLEELVELLQGAQSYQVQLTGYAGIEGLDEFSQSLSERRAWAVYRYLIRRSLDNGRISITATGKRSNIDPNASERVKARSRRVEVKATYTLPGPSSQQDTQASARKPAGMEKESISSTVFTGPNGTRVRVLEGAFAPYTNEDIRLQVRDFLDPMDMMQEELSTIDSAGRCLESAGMVFLKAFAIQEDQEVQLAGDIPLLMEVPADSFDPDMALYRAVTTDSSLRWAPDSVALQRGDRENYLVRILRAGGFNLDKRMLELPLHNEPAKVLAKGYKSPRIFIAHRNKRSWNRLTATGKRLYENLDGCDCGGQNPVLIAFAQKDGQDYLAEVPLRDLRYQSRKQRYVLKKQYYLKVESRK